MESTYVLFVHSPDDPNQILARLESRRPWSRIAPGEVLRVRGLRLRVCDVELDIVERRPVLRVRTARDNVVVMPPDTSSPVADLFRYHAFVERFGCDPDAWLAELRARGRGASGDARFARSLRARMRRDPNVVDAIRRFVEATPLDDHREKRTS